MIDDAGDVWTWIGMDSETKLVISWLSGSREAGDALDFADDLRARIATPQVQVNTDGYGVYVYALDEAFGADAHHGQIVKMYGRPSEEERRRYSPSQCVSVRKVSASGHPDMEMVSTSYVERQNLTVRMSVRRFTRLTNAFSKKLRNHVYAQALYFVWYNFCRPHKTLRDATPAMAAGLEEYARDARWIVGLIDARAPAPKKRGPYKKRKAKISN